MVELDPTDKNCTQCNKKIPESEYVIWQLDDEIWYFCNGICYNLFRFPEGFEFDGLVFEFETAEQDA